MYGYLEFSFHHIDMDNKNFQMSLYASGSRYEDGIIEHDLYYEEDGYQFFTANFAPDGFESLRDKFIGPYRTERDPLAVENMTLISLWYRFQMFSSVFMPSLGVETWRHPSFRSQKAAVRAKSSSAFASVYFSRMARPAFTLLKALTGEGYGLHLFEPRWFEPEEKQQSFKSPTVDHGALAAAQVQAVVPVRPQALTDAVAANLPGGKVQDALHMLTPRARSTWSPTPGRCSAAWRTGSGASPPWTAWTSTCIRSTACCSTPPASGRWTTASASLPGSIPA
mgnify:CR=1 FL=1